MLDDAQRTRILEAVDALFDEQVRTTQDLVRHPSVRGAEHTAQDFMARAMAARGLSVDRWKVEVDDIRGLPGFAPVKVSYENAWNVVGTLRAPSPAGRSLILNGHIDVVPPGPLDRWTTPPFEPRIAGGWMYGRGSGDMKAGLVGCLYALAAIERAGLRPTADIHLQSVVEEECTGNGALACLQRGYRAQAALIPEPLPTLMRAQVGLMWMTIHVLGDPQHASGFQGGGSNAIENAFHIHLAMKALEKRWNARKVEHPLYADHPHPIRFNLGKIAGGDWVSSVPAWCDLEIRVGIYPGWDLEQAKREIEACVRQAALDHPFLSNHPPTIDHHGFMAEGYVLENADEQEALLSDCHARVCGEPLRSEVTSAATDARYFGLYADTPALVYGPVCERAHGFDERVDLESVRRVTKVMSLFVAEWCGVAPR